MDNKTITINNSGGRTYTQNQCVSEAGSGRRKKARQPNVFRQPHTGHEMPSTFKNASSANPTKTKIATWNANSFRSEVAQVNAIDILRKGGAKILLITETHLFAGGKVSYGDYTLFSSPCLKESNNSFAGVGFFLSKDDEINWCPSFTPISDRVGKLTLTEKGNKIHFIVAYASTEVVCERNKDARKRFFDQLRHALQEVDLKRDTIVIGGDFNCRIGKIENSLTTGLHSPSDTTSDSGAELLFFCE